MSSISPLNVRPSISIQTPGPSSIGQSKLSTGSVSMRADQFASQLIGGSDDSGPDLDRLTTGLVNQFRDVNAMQTNADAMVHSMITGGDVNEAEVLTAVQKADLAFRMMLQIRNKLMDAYREIQQIQI